MEKASSWQGLRMRWGWADGNARWTMRASALCPSDFDGAFRGLSGHILDRRIRGAARDALRSPRALSLAVPPLLVEEFGVSFVVEAADERAVPDLHEATLLEDALHAQVVRERRAAHRLQAQSVEAVGEQQLHGLAGVAASAEVFVAYLD